jgi:hypothetical protein
MRVDQLRHYGIFYWRKGWAWEKNEISCSCTDDENDDHVIKVPVEYECEEFI